MQKQGGGVILNNASICAKQPLDYEPIYNTSKAALMMFSKCMSNEFIPDNIRVNCINPGLVLTPDWGKTAGQLTEGTEQTPDNTWTRSPRTFTPDRPLRLARGTGRLLCVSVLADAPATAWAPPITLTAAG